MDYFHRDSASGWDHRTTPLDIPFEAGATVSLHRRGFGVVGKGIIIESSPVGHWLGVDIARTMTSLILVRPTDIKLSALTLPVIPSQTGFTVLGDVVYRTLLWPVEDVADPIGEHPMPDANDETTDAANNGAPYIPVEEWIGMAIEGCSADGAVLAIGRINCASPDKPFKDGLLGEGCVGVTVLDIFEGDAHGLMTHQRWSTLECRFPNGRSLSGTIEYLSMIPDECDPDAHLGGRKKAPYRFIHRKPMVERGLSKYALKTTDTAIHAVTLIKCCELHCCRHFKPEETMALRKKFFLKSFDERREYGISVGGQLHSSDLIGGKRKYVTLVGTEVCSVAWYTIHGIPSSTFFSYLSLFKEGVQSSTHGNRGIKRPRLGTVQAMGTIAAIVKENADLMPHQMRGTVPGRMDTLKFLPAGHNWKRIQAEATEVRIQCSVKICFNLSYYFGLESQRGILRYISERHLFLMVMCADESKLWFAGGIPIGGQQD
jgi:hypothetical protein